MATVTTTEDLRPAAYYQVVVAQGQVTQLVKCTYGHDRHADSGPRWFLLRVGVDRPGQQEVGYHVCDLTRSQQLRIKTYLEQNPTELKNIGEDWLDFYPNEDYEQRRQLYSRERLVDKF